MSNEDHVAWTRGVLALGSNMGDTHEMLFRAVADIRATEGIVVERQSSVHDTTALTSSGYDETKPRYANQVITIRTVWSPKKLLTRLQSIELRHGRMRSGDQYADRTLDIDIITHGAVELSTGTLTLPHPRAHERLFVLEPWLEIDQYAELPGKGAVAALMQSLRETTE